MTYNYNDLNKKNKIITLKEISLAFLKLGFIAFGGPAAHVAMMEDEFVSKKTWLSRSDLLDLISVTHLIPGPNSTELALFIGLKRGGNLGLLLAGFFFILPAMLITTFFAYIYVTFGSLPQLEGFMLGIKPAVIVIILSALLKLGKMMVTSKEKVILAILISILYLFNLSEIAVLFIGGLIFTIYKNKNTILKKKFSLEPTSLSLIFLIFLKIGSVLYGSGYVLLAFLENELINRRSLLTMNQLIDSIAIGDFTPGPVLTTSSFIGYILKGIPGAIVATFGIFLPSFIMVILINKYVKKMRNSKLVSGFLDGVNVASVVLMTFVTYKLAANSIYSLLTLTIFLSVFVLKNKYKINSGYLLIVSGIVGYIINLF